LGSGDDPVAAVNLRWLSVNVVTDPHYERQRMLSDLRCLTAVICYVRFTSIATLSCLRRRPAGSKTGRIN